MRSSPISTRLRPHGIALAAAALLNTVPALAQNAETKPEAKPEAKTEQKAAAPAAAAAATKPAAQTLDTVVVSGTRSSIQSSISRKKNADTVSDSIVAEDVDQFPDKNVGEALSRISGVQLTREFGEGSQVSIRGVEPDLNRVEINGATVLGTNGGGGRGAELRELAAELISSIDVVKGSTADLTEGGVGGTVRINTRKPLEFTKRTVAMSLSAEQSSSRGGVQPRGTLLLADKFLDGKLGVMANIVYDNVHTRNDYSRNTSWSFFRDWDFSPEKTITSLDATNAAITTYAGCTAITNATARTDCQRQWFDYSPRISRYGIWERDHKRSSVDLSAQYRFTDKFDAYITHQVNTQKQRLNDMNFGTSFDNLNRLATNGNAPVYGANGVPTTAGTCTAINANTTPAGMVVENHHVTRYVVGNCINAANQSGQGAFGTSARDFKLDIESKYSTAGFNFKDGDWKVTGLLIDSKSEYWEASNNISLTQNAPGLIVELGADRLPRFTFPTGWNPEDDSSYVQAQLQYRPRATFNTERQGKLDFEYALNRPYLNRLMFGAQARESSSKSYAGGGYMASAGANLASTADDVNVLTANINQTIVWDPLYTGSAQRPNDTQSYINSNHATRYVNAATMRQLIAGMRSRSPGTFFGGYGGVSGVPSSWMAPSFAAAAPSFDTSKFNFGNVFEAMGSDGKIYPQIPAFDIEEKINAGYLRLDWDAEELGVPLYGNIGVRYARTNVKSGGLLTDRVREENSPGSATFTDRIRSNSIVQVDNTYEDVLPSFNATYAPLKGQLLARVGWAKVMSRPALNLLAPNVNCLEGSGKVQFGGDGFDDCTGGNPDLKPYRATKQDFSLEYYPSRDTQVSLALFRTKIDTYVRTGIRTPQVNFFGDGRLFDVTQPVNGQGAQTEGLEIAARTAFTFLPGWLAGFGADVNWTRMDFSYAANNELLSPLDGTVLPYPGLSKNSYNVGLWYDRGLVNARLAYHWRDRYYTGGNDVSGNPNFRDKTAYLDAKIQFRINKNFTLSLEGKNLTDQAEYVYSGDLGRPNELAWSGRRYYASVAYKL